MVITGRSLKQLFVDFFITKNHQEINSAALLPENDPTTLFISAGMHPLVPYLLGQPHPQGKRLVNVQKCVRTGDIDEVGDTTHHTFFEMLGNWSLGDYFKKESLDWSLEFLTTLLGINPKDLFVTCFAGDENAPKDLESFQIWRDLGIPEDRIMFLPKNDNWWGPAGTTGPCGPDSEIFVDTAPSLPKVDFKSGNKANRYVEIWNNVFMQYTKTSSGTYEVLAQQNVDTGMGVERTVAILNGYADDYLSQIWQPIILQIENLSSRKYGDSTDCTQSMRILADHLRAAVFIATDGVIPANKESGYVLRRLIRRSVRQCLFLNIPSIRPIVEAIYANQPNYAGNYPELDQNKEKTIQVLLQEEQKFKNTIQLGLKEIDKLIIKKQTVSGQDAFKLYESYGFPVELIQEELKKHSLELDLESFNQQKQIHQDASRSLSAGKFKSGLADHTKLLTRMHTATHLLQAALRQVLGGETHQDGSNNTSERIRFDFTYNGGKLTDKQKQDIENLVNQKIQQDLPVAVETMPLAKAQADGALAFFKARYPEVVSVYSVGDFSKEVCTGPHVLHTAEIGHFTIYKEESVSGGIRRIYAKLD